ncbi:uncharacterized protein PHALS_14124 [Plasmopara halstedii]|uniref:Uncharacterized protein n=1 Tax=Plasmopara halstedii TaxID=4781 RepID=A0A0N7L6B8_PLAHL|nr:uncharacterized protein PHALS_14124 [Plasmopara halstedii]CEG43835.1 hypothetical protein PHALS_14124 [Plasmopara halstedii]|eukprot:XP_024580204.1 hypothetical protein PHALS_14124 [Plasmopara halstedii]
MSSVTLDGMETSSPRTWAQQREINRPPSNQRIAYSDRTEIPVTSKKKVNGVTSITSPEFENSSSDSKNDDHEDIEKHICTDKETYEALKQRYWQLQEDIAVLAAHMDKQEIAYKRERSEAEVERLTLLQTNATLKSELDALRVEKDALIKQSTRMAAQQAEEEQQTNDAREAHEELLRALAQQQQETKHFQTLAACADQDRKDMRKALDKAQIHCSRLEEELTIAHTQVLHLQSERDTLQAALDAAATGAANLEARQLQEQDELIANLRANLLQMEFELKTLSADKATLEEKLQLRSAIAQYANFDVVPLDDSVSDMVSKRKGPNKRTTIRPVKASKEALKRRGSDIFNNLTELPNAVTESRECASAPIWSSSTPSFRSNKNQNDIDSRQRHSFRDRIAPPSGFSSLVAKTVQSARKHLATPLQNTFGNS